jgi:hypothetical protein
MSFASLVQMFGNAHHLKQELFGAMRTFSFLRLGHYFYLRFRRMLRWFLGRHDGAEQPLHHVWDVNTPEPAWGWLPLVLTSTALYYFLRWLWRLVFPHDAIAHATHQPALTHAQPSSTADTTTATDPVAAAWPPTNGMPPAPLAPVNPAVRPMYGAPGYNSGYGVPGYAGYSSYGSPAMGPGMGYGSYGGAGGYSNGPYSSGSFPPW